jgi:hypothetical protein
MVELLKKDRYHTLGFDEMAGENDISMKLMTMVMMTFCMIV